MKKIVMFFGLASLGLGCAVNAGDGGPTDEAVGTTSSALTDGALDPSFDNDGKVTLFNGANETARYRLAVLPNNAVIAGGWTSPFQRGDHAFVNFDAGGNVDTTHANGGYTWIRTGCWSSTVTALTLSGSYLWAAGTCTDYATGVGFSEKMWVGRFRRWSAHEIAFGSASVIRINVFGLPTEMKAGPNGSVYIAGDVYGGTTFMAKVSSTGVVDPPKFISQETKGHVESTRGLYVYSNGLAATVGTITRPNGAIDSFVRRFRSTDLGLDTTFAINSSSQPGTVVVPGATFEDVAVTDNKIVAAGSTQGSSGRVFLLTRFNSIGSMTTWKPIDFGSTANEIATSIAVGQDGKVVLGGTAYGSLGQFALARVNPDDSLDDGMDGLDDDGKVLTDFASLPHEGIERIAILNGKITAVGRGFDSQGKYHMTLARWQY